MSTNPVTPNNPVSDTAASADAPTQIAIQVTFDLNTPDGLRKVHFGLEKDVVGTDIIWKICFTLFERANTTVAFGDPIVSLSVQVDPALNARANQAVKA